MPFSNLFNQFCENHLCPILILNKDLEIVYQNKSAENKFGKAQEAKESKIFSELKAHINKYINSDKPSIKTDCCTISLLKEDNKTYYVIEVNEESSNKQLTFLSNMSHEIRTPLNSIVGFSELIEYGDLTKEEIKEYTKVIKNNGDMLLHLVEDVIDVSKIELNKLKVESTKCPINPLISDVYNTFYSLQDLNNTKIELKVNLDKDDNFQIMTDPYRLKQVLINLVSNAFKFTKEGEIEIGYKLLEDNIKLYVKDSGRGISDEEQREIFNRFNQGKIEGIDKIKGHGLGLAISQGLSYYLGGELKLKSELGKGSEFYLLLPKSKLIEEPEKKEEVKEGKPDFSSKHILIAEDIAENFKFLEKALEPTGAKISWAKNGLEAVEAIKNGHIIDLILMDIKMPKMDGNQALKEIKKINSKCPVIAQTAYALEYEEILMIENGFDDYMSKPIKISTLYSKIKKFI